MRVRVLRGNVDRSNQPNVKLKVSFVIIRNIYVIICKDKHSSLYVSEICLCFFNQFEAFIEVYGGPDNKICKNGKLVIHKSEAIIYASFAQF